MNTKQIVSNENLISHCGFYCGACPTHLSGKCEGCRGNSSKCAVGMKNCQVKQCCVENEFFTCADCTKFATTRNCKKYNPLSIRFGEWISNTSRNIRNRNNKRKGTITMVGGKKMRILRKVRKMCVQERECDKDVSETKLIKNLNLTI